MPRSTIRETSSLPSLVLACSGLALAYPLLHDAVDRRILTAESMFHSPVTVILAALGVGMAGILLWDFFADRRSR